MRRQEWVLVALAIVFVGIAAACCIYAGQAQASLNSDASITAAPWQYALLQASQVLAPPFALVGFAIAVGILFSCAARWTPRIADEPDELD